MGTQYLKTNLAVVDYAAETQNHLFNLDDLISRLTAPPGKTSFLVFRNNKYITVRTENIAYFYVKYDSATLVSFDGQEYVVELLPGPYSKSFNAETILPAEQTIPDQFSGGERS